MNPPLPKGNPLVVLRNSLMAADQQLRGTSPKCQVCGLPTGGIVFAGQSDREGGICTRADHVGKRKHYCQGISEEFLLPVDRACAFCDK